jgi:tetratricopeptide (TPR) repeat protein
MSVMTEKQRKSVRGTLKEVITHSLDDRILGEAMYQAGRLAHIRGDLATAKARYKEAVGRHPKHPRAHYELALIAAAKGKERPTQKALEHMKDAIHELKDFFEANALMGLIYAELFQRTTGHTKLKHLNSGIQYLEAAVGLKDKDRAVKVGERIKVYKTLGWLRLKSLEFDKAETALWAAFQLQEEGERHVDDTVLTFLGIAQFQSGRKVEALATFLRCEDQSQPVLRFNIARCQEEFNRFSEARAIYKGLHAEFPRFPEPLFRLSALALRDTRPRDVNPEVKQYLQTIIEEIDQNNVRALLELGNVAARSGQFREARKSMERAQENASAGDGSIYATVSIANYLLESAQTKTDTKERNERLDLAQKHFVRALKENHGCIFAANGMALCWLLTDHVAEAKERLLLVKDYRPDLASSWENLGLAYMKEQSYSAALALFEEANRKFFEKTDVNLLLQSHAAAKGEKKYEVCLSIAQQLCQLRPETGLHWYLLASSLHKAVIAGLRAAESKGLRVQPVKRWMKQLARCVALFEFCRKTADPKLATGITEKINNIRDHLIPKFENQFLPQAEKLEAQRQLEFQRDSERLATEADPDEDGIPRPE